MTTIDGTKVTHTHGDTLFLTFPLENEDGTPYVIGEGDTLTFLLRKEPGRSPIIIKNVPTDTCLLCLTAAETEALGSGPINGHYVYDVKLTTAEGHVDTVINLGELFIKDEV